MINCMHNELGLNSTRNIIYYPLVIAGNTCRQRCVPLLWSQSVLGGPDDKPQNDGKDNHKDQGQDELLPSRLALKL